MERNFKFQFQPWLGLVAQLAAVPPHAGFEIFLRDCPGGLWRFETLAKWFQESFFGTFRFTRSHFYCLKWVSLDGLMGSGSELMRGLLPRPRSSLCELPILSHHFSQHLFSSRKSSRFGLASCYWNPKNLYHNNNRRTSSEVIFGISLISAAISHQALAELSRQRSK